ncbi:MAG: STAS-like domain-containing protein [Candidatus Berkelbacteria bacterium]|nr:STAS-like domain-containing protein [Candidatus Berkelbacteria bacterium]
MKTIKIHKYVGVFAEDKDAARNLRTREILPALETGQAIMLDFANVTGATQSFIHALISEVIRLNGPEVYERLIFKNCSPEIQQVVNIVADYMAEG